MASNVMPELGLAAEAKDAVWRIFGSGHSPFEKLSPCELIEPIVDKYVIPTERRRVVAEIGAWFESDGRLSREMMDPVAVLILEAAGELVLEGAKAKVVERAAWAVASIDADRAAQIIRTHWSPKQTACFVEAVIETLTDLADGDEALDPKRAARYVGIDGDAKIPKNEMERNGKVETFHHMETYGSRLVHSVIRDEVSNLMELVLQLQPEQFEAIIKTVDHPVLRARAASYMIDRAPPQDYRKPLHWITGGSCDELIALGIVHTLHSVDNLDKDVRDVSRLGTAGDSWRTELRHPQDNLDAAAEGAITELVDRLASLDPPACMRWVGELLVSAPKMLSHDGAHEVPGRIKQLERACIALLGRLCSESWSEDLVVRFCEGLRLSPSMTWTRHLSELAWEIRGDNPAHATEIARNVLGETERQVAEHLEHSHLHLSWNYWEDREWMSMLGVALSLSCDGVDLTEWVSERCRLFPVSVWDAEDDVVCFSVAESAVPHWFLVAFLAIPFLKELGRVVDPAAVRALAESLWAHCRFAGEHLLSEPQNSLVAEYAARTVAEYGDPSDVWLLEQGRHLGVGPRSLWALFHQRSLKSAREGRADAQYDEMVAAEFLRITSDRFGDGGQFGIEELKCWGELWLVLGASDEAERTSMAITSALPRDHRPRDHSRVYHIMALKLLAMAQSRRGVLPETGKHAQSIYKDLWSGSYTPYEELEDRRQIDELLGK